MTRSEEQKDILDKNNPQSEYFPFYFATLKLILLKRIISLIKNHFRKESPPPKKAVPFLINFVKLFFTTR